MDWRLKIAAKIALARLPVPYSAWKRLGLFAHGAAEDPAYARSVFEKHLGRARAGRALSEGFTCLELGPGDSVMSAIVAKALGGGRAYLVDVGPFAHARIPAYRDASEGLRAAGFPAPDLSQAKSLEDVLAACDCDYLTDGLTSLRTIPEGSVDFAWSHAVLQHVRRSAFAETVQELRRVMRPQGVQSHRVNLKDHLQGGLNNLRFGSRVWESRPMTASGFYTNRLRASQVLDIFTKSGFAVDIVATDRWAEPPLPRRRLAPEFSGLSDEDLRIHGLDFLAICL